MKRLLIVSFSLLVACGGTSPRPAPVSSKGGTGLLPAADAILVVGTGDARREIRISPDGEVRSGAGEGGRLTADGRLTDAAGTLMATLAADGSVTLPGEPAAFVIQPDGTLLAHGEVGARFGDDGVMVGEMLGENDHFAAEGDPAGRRAVMLLLVGTMAAVSGDFSRSSEPRVAGSGPTIDPSPSWSIKTSTPAAAKALPCDRGARPAVHGIVTDQSDGQPLAAVTVIVRAPGDEQGTVEMTGEDGCFFVGDLAPGPYHVDFYYADSTASQAVTLAAKQVATVHADISPAR